MSNPKTHQNLKNKLIKKNNHEWYLFVVEIDRFNQLILHHFIDCIEHHQLSLLFQHDEAKYYNILSYFTRRNEYTRCNEYLQFSKVYSIYNSTPIF